MPVKAIVADRVKFEAANMVRVGRVMAICCYESALAGKRVPCSLCTEMLLMYISPSVQHISGNIVHTRSGWLTFSEYFSQ